MNINGGSRSTPHLQIADKGGRRLTHEKKKILREKKEHGQKMHREFARREKKAILKDKKLCRLKCRAKSLLEIRKWRARHK